jgi:hypothetical protein
MVAAETPWLIAIESQVSPSFVVYVILDTQIGVSTGKDTLKALLVALKSATEMLQVCATYLYVVSQLSSYASV